MLHHVRTLRCHCPAHRAQHQQPCSGAGHYGVTYLCSSLASADLVAIKALDKTHPEYERDLAVEEILVLAAVCDHPNVVAMHEAWEDAEYIYIVMVGRCRGGGGGGGGAGWVGGGCLAG